MARSQLSDDEVIAALERQFDRDSSVLLGVVLAAIRAVGRGLVALGGAWHTTAATALAAARSNGG